MRLCVYGFNAYVQTDQIVVVVFDQLLNLALDEAINFWEAVTSWLTGSCYDSVCVTS